jgi:ADP-heptose:LPS heptosyltransferase
MKHIIILRFSAITDVAIAAPLVRSYAFENPEISFTMVSDPFLRPLFKSTPNLSFFPVSITEKPSWRYLLKIAKSICALSPTEIIDLQNCRYTTFLKSFFAFKNIPVFTAEKPSFNKNHFSSLPSLLQLYENAFSASGLKNLHLSDEHPVFNKTNSKYEFHRVGIAPFAKHPGKSWPVKNMEEVVAHLSKDPNTKVYLFGNQRAEAEILQKWEDKYDDCESIAGKYTLSEELELIRSLDLMVTMDSANMHFASSVNTPVISIWGATHPHGGFYGWGQDWNNVVSVDLPCRPCSLFGDKKCERMDYACLSRVTPEMVLKKIDEFFNYDKK